MARARHGASVSVYDGRDVTGSSGSRAERADESAADPQNLTWVMPAEEDVPNEVVVVVSGGEPPHPHAARSAPLGATMIAADKGLFAMRKILQRLYDAENRKPG